jgi:hypothetical protein
VTVFISLPCVDIPLVIGYIFAMVRHGKQSSREKDSLLIRNAQFYEAFENGDIETLDELWSHSRQVKCIHPGWEILVGWRAVKRSWQSIFASGVNMKISLRNINVEVYGTLGIVVLVEDVVYRSGTTTHSGAVMATNLFEFDDDVWKMIHHHGSPMVMTQEDEDDRYRYN